jgi:uncharacterized membrane protein
MAIPKLLRPIIRPFVAGLIAVLPIGLTVAIIAWLAAIATKLFGPGSAVGSILKRFGWNIGPTDTGAYLGGVLFAVMLIYGLGLLVEFGLKGRWESLTGGILSKLPLINTIYDASKKIVQMVEPRDSPDIQSMTPILCHFGGEDGTVFPAFLPTSETVDIQGTEYHVVMIPTAPVPFGGAIMCVPKQWVTKLDCGIDGLFNIFMSMGTTVPEIFRQEALAKTGEKDQSRNTE